MTLAVDLHEDLVEVPAPVRVRSHPIDATRTGEAALAVEKGVSTASVAGSGQSPADGGPGFAMMRAAEPMKNDQDSATNDQATALTVRQSGIFRAGLRAIAQAPAR